MPPLLSFQIMIDVVFFVIIMLLLRQLNQRVKRGVPKVDHATVGELKKMMADSQSSADTFLQEIQKGEERLGKLARQLDQREKRIIILIEKAESLIQKMASQQADTGWTGSDGEKYEQIMRMVREGLGREEIAKRLGVSMGEIELVVELEQTRATHPQTGSSQP